MAKRNNGEGSVTKRKDGRWEGRYYTGEVRNGKRVRKNVLAKSKSECIEKLKKAMADSEKEQQILNHCTYLDTSNPTLEEWYHIWLDAFLKASAKEYTVQSYKGYFESKILPRIGNMKLTEISTVTCQQMLMDLYENGRERYTDRKGNGLSVKTVKDIKIALQACLQKAVDEQIISTNPCKKVQLPKEAPKEMQTLKSEELSAFLNEARDSGWYEFYYLELTTGLRLGEITALTWDDLDIKNKTISVNKQVQRINGEIVVTRPKTDASIRKVSLCDECLNQLLILRSRQRLDTKIMFPSPATGGYRDPNAITRRLHSIQRRAGVPQIRFHDLRHSFATLSLEQGMDIKTISHMLGHTDAGFTMNTYMHVTDNMQQTVATAMGNLISEKEQEHRDKIIHFSA